jgi:hypothetical protein
VSGDVDDSDRSRHRIPNVARLVDRPTIGPGGGFGEIARVHDTPRTPPCARPPLRLYTLDRRHFLSTVSGYQSSASGADRLMRDRLGTFDPDDDNDRLGRRRAAAGQLVGGPRLGRRRAGRRPRGPQPRRPQGPPRDPPGALRHRSRPALGRARARPQARPGRPARPAQGRGPALRARPPAGRPDQPAARRHRPRGRRRRPRGQNRNGRLDRGETDPNRPGNSASPSAHPNARPERAGTSANPGARTAPQPPAQRTSEALDTHDRPAPRGRCSCRRARVGGGQRSRLPTAVKG